jgi:hypothetical protein
MAKKLKIHNKEIAYDVVYRDVKHPRLEFKTGSLLLIIPKNWKETEDELIRKHKNWIYKKHSQILLSLKEARHKRLICNRNAEIFKEYVCQKLKDYIDDLGLKIKKIIFRTMKTKWASCSSNRNITVNTLLKFLPEDIIDYVLFHEIVHLKEKRHNKRFWDIVTKKFSAFADKEKDLMTYWFLIQKKIRSTFG